MPIASVCVYRVCIVSMEIFARCIAACFREADIALSISDSPVLEVPPRARRALRDVTRIERGLQYVLIQFKFVLT